MGIRKGMLMLTLALIFTCLLILTLSKASYSMLPTSCSIRLVLKTYSAYTHIYIQYVQTPAVYVRMRVWVHKHVYIRIFMFTSKCAGMT